MRISARLVAALAVALLPAAPSAAQAMQSVRVGGYVAPRCFAGVPAMVRNGGGQGSANVRCNSARPAITVVSRRPAVNGSGGGDDRLVASEAGYVIFDMPAVRNDSGAVEIVVSPVA